MISAVVLSAKPIGVSLPGVTIVNHVSQFADAKGLLDARLEAIGKVQTKWFFFLDDDDELPEDYPRILDKCISVKTPLAYTDELITSEDGASKIRKSESYSEDKFIRNRTLIHHLAVCKTDAALKASKVIPRGTYAIENLLFFQIAKQGATYIDEIGYIWHRRQGLHKHHSIAVGFVQSAIWANRNKS